MTRPPFKSARIAERVAREMGATSIAWDAGTRHIRMIIGMPDGRTIVQQLGNHPQINERRLEDFVRQKIRRELRNPDRAFSLLTFSSPHPCMGEHDAYL